MGPLKSFTGPQGVTHVTFNQILKVIEAPHTTTGRNYRLSDNDYHATLLRFQQQQTL